MKFLKRALRRRIRRSQHFHQNFLGVIRGSCNYFVVFSLFCAPPKSQNRNSPLNISPKSTFPKDLNDDFLARRNPKHQTTFRISKQEGGQQPTSIANIAALIFALTCLLLSGREISRISNDIFCEDDDVEISRGASTPLAGASAWKRVYRSHRSLSADTLRIMPKNF